MPEREKLRIRTSSSWWIDHTDGDVTLVILRRRPMSEGGYHELRYRGTSEADAEALYVADSDERGEQRARQAERRNKWGPSPAETTAREQRKKALAELRARTGL